MTSTSTSTSTSTAAFVRRSATARAILTQLRRDGGTAANRSALIRSACGRASQATTQGRQATLSRMADEGLVTLTTTARGWVQVDLTAAGRELAA